MEKEEKLDEILRKRNDKLKSKILDIYQNTKSFLSRSIGKEGENLVYREDGNIEYSLAIDADNYRFQFTYSNFNKPHMKIEAYKKYYATNQWGGVSKTYGDLYTVLDVIEQPKDNLHVNTYLSGEDDKYYHIIRWEEALMELIKKRPTTKNGKLPFLPNMDLAQDPYDF
jgi:hypothetical protein